MKKRKDSEIEEKKNKKKTDEPEAKWSFKRIGIFLAILVILLFIGYYFVQSRVGQVLGEKEVASERSGPQIELPNRENIDNIIKNAEENISEINTNDIVSSQPQIQNAIKELEKLTNQDNVKDQVCSSLCGN